MMDYHLREAMKTFLYADIVDLRVRFANILREHQDKQDKAGEGFRDAQMRAMGLDWDIPEWNHDTTTPDEERPES